jgi:2-polyprenyl-3-methyl-5-hydroxy-6-metoxy-1,4-benzoquinol methylase
MTRLDASRKFWDEKARENPYWYVSSAGPYEGRDMADFWASGPRIWSDLKHITGYKTYPEAVIVEIGCGVGRLTRALAQEAGHVHAFDVSSEMLKVAAASITESNVTFHLATSPELPQLPEGCADLFVAYCVFQHLQGTDMLRRYLEAAARVLKPGGLLIFSLTPPDWRDRLAVALRARRWLVELSSADGPRGLYKREWYGIRPSKREVEQICPIAVRQTDLHGDKWLFHGRR